MAKNCILSDGIDIENCILDIVDNGEYKSYRQMKSSQ